MKRQLDDGYFDTPPEFRIGFVARESGSASVIVDYAYCETDNQCFLRTATVDLLAGAETR